MHAPSVLNHTPNEIVCAWGEVISNLQGKRTSRVMAVGVNREFNMSGPSQDDDDDNEVDDDGGGDDDEPLMTKDDETTTIPQTDK